MIVVAELLAQAFISVSYIAAVLHTVDVLNAHNYTQLYSILENRQSVIFWLSL